MHQLLSELHVSFGIVVVVWKWLGSVSFLCLFFGFGLRNSKNSDFFLFFFLSTERKYSTQFLIDFCPIIWRRNQNTCLMCALICPLKQQSTLANFIKFPANFHFGKIKDHRNNRKVVLNGLFECSTRGDTHQADFIYQRPFWSTHFSISPADYIQTPQMLRNSGLTVRAKGF